MKKVLLITATLITVLSSCNSTYENHELRIVYPNMAGIYNGEWLYPGIQEDSIKFFTTDSYSMQLDESWAHFRGVSSQNLPYVPGNVYGIKHFVDFDQNYTGNMRVCTASVSSYEWKAYAVYYQPGWHDVRTREKSVIQYFPNSSSVPLKMAFSQTATASQTTDTLSFNLHCEALLSVSEDGTSDWVKITDANMGENFLAPSGYHKVNLEFTPNTSSQERKATLKLTGNTVTTDITLIQKGVQ